MMHASFMEMGSMLADRLARHNPLFKDAEREDVRSVDTNPFAGRRDRRHPSHYQRDDDDWMRQHDQRWDFSFKVEIPEFHGGPHGEALLDWIATVDELKEFRQVPEKCRVPFMTMRFRGHASSWWKQVKITRHRIEKPHVVSWPKLQKHLKATFLPHNCERTNTIPSRTPPRFS